MAPVKSPYKIMIALILMLVAFGCGATSEEYDSSVVTQVDPFVNRIAPVSAAAGDTVTIFGFGFSSAPGLDVVIVGSTETFAGTYALVVPPAVAEIESLTFTVPAGTPLGVHNVYVDVLDNVSNANVTITITP